jgi:hypothetical protein
MTTSSITAKRPRLAAAIERDLLRSAPKPQSAPPCFTCGRSYSRGDGRFCHPRCRSAFDAGAPAYEPPDLGRFYSLPKGPAGFWIDCAHCGKRFESRGWRTCAVDCRRKAHERRANEADMADAGIEIPTKRKCEQCGDDIPNWRGGRRVSKATRFCSSKCGQRHRKKAPGLSDSPTPFQSVQTAISGPENGPRRDDDARPSVIAEAAE